jgi:hypothetical protein
VTALINWNGCHPLPKFFAEVVPDYWVLTGRSGCDHEIGGRGWMEADQVMET